MQKHNRKKLIIESNITKHVVLYSEYSLLTRLNTFNPSHSLIPSDKELYNLIPL